MNPSTLTTTRTERGYGPYETFSDPTIVLGARLSQQSSLDGFVDPTLKTTSDKNLPQSAAPGTQSSSMINGDTTLAIRDSTHELPAPIKLVVVAPITTSSERFNLLQLWEGVVQEVKDDSIVLTLIDQTNRDNPDEEAVISIAEIPDGDRNLVHPGAVLYWSIGYKEGPGQPRERVSRIRFRRLPAWSKTDIERARANAQELAHLLGTD